LTGDAEGDLRRLGKKVSDAVKLWQFSFLAKAQPIVFKKGGKTLVAPPQVETEPKLTDAGYALAADMGLLVARLLLEACGGRVRRMLVTKPKRDVVSSSCAHWIR
jgi:hypothetical protein